MTRKVMSTYQKVQANTASPGQRVVMVYKGICKSLQTAVSCLADKSPDNLQTAHDSIQLAQKLITELQLALDKERGGDVAENLDKLYTFWHEYLSEANVEKDAKKVREVLSMIKEMTESWVVAERKFRTEQPETHVTQ